MALKRLTKFELAFLAGIILIIPFIIVFQLSKADIVIDITSITNGCESINDVFICTYVSDPNRVIIKITESNDAWVVTGNCITTVGERFGKGIVENPEIFFSPPPFDTVDNCIDLIIFDKDMYDREFSFNSELGANVNKFTLVNPNTLEPPQMNMIGG